VVEYGLRTHKSNKPVEALRGETLEPGIGIAPPPNSVDDVGAEQMRIDHPLDCAEVVLKVGVHTDQCVTLRGEKAGEEGVLVATVARQFDADDRLTLVHSFFDQPPRRIAAAVVHEIDPTGSRHLARSAQRIQNTGQTRDRLRKHLFLVEAGNNHAQVNHRLLRL